MAATGKAEQLGDRSVDIARLLQELGGRFIDPAEYADLIGSENPRLRVTLAEGARLAASEVQGKFYRPQLGEAMAVGRLIKVGRSDLKGQAKTSQKLTAIGRGRCQNQGPGKAQARRY